MGKHLKVMIAVMFALVLIGSTYAFAAANTIPDSSAGQGEKVVSGYTITNLVYDLNASDPTKVDQVTFTVTPDGPNSVAAATVYLQVIDGGSWTTCTVGDPDGSLAVVAKCTYGSLLMSEINKTNIVASSTADITVP